MQKPTVIIYKLGIIFSKTTTLSTMLIIKIYFDLTIIKNSNIKIIKIHYSHRYTYRYILKADKTNYLSI